MLISGCNDSLALNYYPAKNMDDGSCYLSLGAKFATIGNGFNGTNGFNGNFGKGSSIDESGSVVAISDPYSYNSKGSIKIFEKIK